MRTLLVVLLFYVFSCEKVIEMQIQEENVYVYESAPKISGQGFIGFVITDSTSVIQRISYKVAFSDNHIKKVSVGMHKDKHTYVKKHDGSIYVEGMKLLAYNSENFKNKDKLNTQELYKLLGNDFLVKTNKEKIDVLDKLPR